MAFLEQVLLDIRAATDRSDVVKAVSDFLTRPLPVDIAALPVQCQTLLRTNVSDVLAAAMIFAQAEITFEGSAEAVACMHEISCTLMFAATRIAQLS